MNDRLVTFTFTSEAQAAGSAVHAFQPWNDITIVAVDLYPEEFSGSPTAFNIDIQDDGTDVITGIDANTAGTVGTWRSTHTRGSNDPVTIKGGSKVSIDVNFTGGTSPTADYTITIYALMGEAA